MSAINVNSITGRTGTHGPVLTGVTTVTGGTLNTAALNVTGAASFSGNVSIAGTLSYEDVTDIDSVGIITAQSGIHVTGGVQVATGATISGSTNTITALTNGSERLRITSAGDVGIGLTNPSEKLHTIGDVMIQGTGGVGEQTLFIGKSATVIPSTRGVAVVADQDSAANHDMVLKTSTNSSGLLERVRITSGGKILAGYTADISGGGLQISGNGNAGNAGFHRFDANDSGPFIQLLKSRNGTVGGNTIVQSGDELGTLNFQGADGTDFHSAARVIAKVDGTPGNNDMPGRIEFHTTADGASSPTERLRISSEGVLSFKNTSPPAWSTDSGYANATFGGSGYLRTDTDTSSNFLSLGINAYRGSSGWNFTTDGGWATQLQTSATNGSIAYSVSTSNGDAGQSITWSEKFRITSDGHVTKPSNAAFRAQGNTQYANQTSSFDLIYDNEIFDAGGNYNPTNGRFTAPVDGKYFFYYVFLTYPDNDPAYKTLGFKVNGTLDYGYGFTRKQSSSQNSNQVSTFLDLSANDYVIPHVQIPSGTYDVYMVTGHAHFFGYLVS